MRRFVSVWLPNWPLTRLARATPGKVPEYEPFALVDVAARGLVITAINAAAAREGLVPGMAVSDARAALPALRVCPGDRTEDARALFKLSQWAGRYGPSCSHDDGMDGFWCDTTGVAHLYGGEEDLLNDLLARLDANRIPARAALADTYGAAHALARYSVREEGAFVLVPGGSTQAALAHLPIECLRLAATVTVLLKRLGLKRVGDLYVIPRANLAHRFSSEDAAQHVLLRLDQALGVQAEPLKPYVELPPFFVRRSFPEPLITSAPLEAVIEAMCDEAAVLLKEKDLGTCALRLDYYRADGTVGVTGARMRDFSNDAAHFKMLLRPKFATIDAGFGIDLVSLSALETGPCSAKQPGFSEDGAAAYDPGPLIDTLSNRLGSDAVVTLYARQSHIPERSEVRVPSLKVASRAPSPSAGAMRGKPLVRNAPPAGSPVSKSEANYTPSWPYGRRQRRPPLLLSRPEPISVVAEVPDGPPARFVWRRVERRIARAQGPERIAPEWWRAIGMGEGRRRVRTRDYYEIEDEAGAAYWVFRHGLYSSEEEGEYEPPSWFLHGLFC